MKLLITGGTGLIGRKLLRVLRPEGWSLRLLLLPGEPAPEVKVRPVIGDITEPDTLKAAVRGIDTVLHMAALTHSHRGDEYFRVNTAGTENLVKAAEAAAVKNFVFISSYTAGSTGGAYAESKFRAEEKVIAGRLSWTILRPSEVYGAGESEAISRIVRMIEVGRTIPLLGGGRQQLYPVYIDDLIGAIRSSLRRPDLKRTYTIAGPEAISMADMVRRLGLVLHKEPKTVSLPPFVFYMIAALCRLGGSRSLVRDQIPRLQCVKSADIEAARQDLGFSPRPLEAGIAALLADRPWS